MAAIERVTLECPECAQDIAIDFASGGSTARPGGFVLRCENCQKVFEFDVDRDPGNAGVVGGADVVATYHADDREHVLRRHGLL